MDVWVLSSERACFHHASKANYRHKGLLLGTTFAVLRATMRMRAGIAALDSDAVATVVTLGVESPRRPGDNDDKLV